MFNQDLLNKMNITYGDYWFKKEFEISDLHDTIKYGISPKCITKIIYPQVSTKEITEEDIYDTKYLEIKNKKENERTEEEKNYIFILDNAAIERIIFFFDTKNLAADTGVFTFVPEGKGLKTPYASVAFTRPLAFNESYHPTYQLLMDYKYNKKLGWQLSVSNNGNGRIKNALPILTESPTSNLGAYGGNQPALRMICGPGISKEQDPNTNNDYYVNNSILGGQAKVTVLFKLTSKLTKLKNN